ncbi:uncharacterized protein LOC133805209 isoform X2 [Humulus lupulus]|uniref:uncharacterized protein LOC133805209 isoform X2 n=1 Tax=Humulus lupulus TaxID=3486 RepID=UPI002B41821E|nr:uncharacterized protein LOC133805209 isoform X2 [Humulus lupulus]
MSTAIFFIAVQCCQCSTMQRRKNSKSNKWTCVVCNQKQSIRNVFAQGPMAKDLRLFVQSFNMSHQFTDASSDLITPSEQPSPPPTAEADCKRQRIDWTEFLDSDEEIGRNTEREDRTGFGDELEIVTELPMGFFKRAKLNEKDGRELENGGYGDKLLKPVFSERNLNIQSQDKEKPMMHHDLETSMDDTSKLSHKRREGDQKTRTKEKGRESSSKWSSYLIEDDEVSPCGNAGKLEENSGNWGDNIFQTLTNEERVEDDEIHPDFL